MANVIQNTIQNVIGDGARPTKFEIQILLPKGTIFNSDENVSIMAKASTFPTKSNDIMEMKYRGRSVPVKGQVKYNQTWDCTFYLTEDHSLKIAFEQWIEALDQKNNYDTPATLGVKNLQNYFANSKNYTTNIIIAQKDFDMKKSTAIYTLKNAFPTTISPVDISSENVGQISEFTVTFAFSHYITTNSSTINEIDEINNSISSSSDYLNSLLNNSVLATASNYFNDILERTEQDIFNEVTGSINNALDDLFQGFF